MTATEDSRTWRPRRTSVAGLVAMAFLGVWAAASAMQASPADGIDRDPAVAIVALTSSVVLLASAFRPFIELDGDVVRFRNLVATHELELDRIVEVSCGYWGTVFQTRERDYTCIAVQRSNAASLTATTTRADEMIEAIRAAKDSPGPHR